MDERLDQSELDALWNFDDPRASADRFAKAAAESDGSELVRAEWETQRARALGLQQRFDEAEALLDSLEPAIGRLDVRIRLERGRILTSAGRAEEAIPLFEEALAHARRDGEVFLAVDAAHMLALADPTRSAEWTVEGLAELAATSDPRTLRWAVSLHSSRGWQVFDEGMPESALTEFVAAENAARMFGTEQQVFRARWTVARCLRELGRVSEAIEIQRRLVIERPEDPDVAVELAALTDVGGTIEP